MTLHSAQSLAPETRLELARRLFREYYASCFWHWRRDLEITEADIPALIKGLRANGNRQAFLEAAKLVSEG